MFDDYEYEDSEDYTMSDVSAKANKRSLADLRIETDLIEFAKETKFQSNKCKTTVLWQGK